MTADFRSDTVTRPTAAMRRAMAEAVVGDDVYGEDPTVRRLEERTAELLGTEAALFVPSGTMGNQIALRVLARPGTEVIVEDRSHVFDWEMGGMAALSGLSQRPVASRRGCPEPADVAARIRSEQSYDVPRTSLLSLENTHNYAGGAVLPRERVDALLALARERGLAVHLDGARLWNAAAALGVPESEVARGFDSVMTCFSKGLRAPVGSAVSGSKAFVVEARRVRKLYGGGMRQAGVIAAAALVALNEERSRLPEDHARARRLWEGLRDVKGLAMESEPPQTNILMVPFDAARLGSADALLGSLRERGVLAGAAGTAVLRLVTHADVGDDAVERALAAFREIAA